MSEMGHSRPKRAADAMSGLAAVATENANVLAKRGRQLLEFFCWSEVNVTTSGDDAASHSGGRGTNRSGDRDRRDGPTHAHARGRL